MIVKHYVNATSPQYNIYIYMAICVSRGKQGDGQQTPLQRDLRHYLFNNSRGLDSM